MHQLQMVPNETKVPKDQRNMFQPPLQSTPQASFPSPLLTRYCSFVLNFIMIHSFRNFHKNESWNFIKGTTNPHAILDVSCDRFMMHA